MDIIYSSRLARFDEEIYLASFNMHLSVGLSASGIAAITTMVANLASEKQVILYFVLGTVGSLLPDIDADNSTPLQIAFSLASMLLAFLLMFFFAGTFPSVIELALIWLATYLFFRWIIFALFTRLTTHRGIFHSVPAALFFGCLTAATTHGMMNFAPLQAWMSGIFVSYGYLVHLVLDEVYSVNVFGMRTRRSFGSAFKLYSSGSVPATLYMYLALLGAFFIAPSLSPLSREVIDGDILQTIQQRLLPGEGWFGWNLDHIAQPRSAFQNFYDLILL
jgi:hypothetical protein